MDFALSKNFKLRERMNLQIRADMFNFLNHVNYGGPSTGIDGATFGRDQRRRRHAGGAVERQAELVIQGESK